MGFNSRNRRRGRRHDSKGRSITKERFVLLWYWFLDCPAWLSMKCEPRMLYIQIRRRFNGSNNGEIFYSIRDACRELRIAKDTAQKAFRELEAKGFIKCAQRGNFNYKVRHASCWILTDEKYGEQSPTKEFMRWEPETEAGPKIGRKCPKPDPK